MNTIFNSVCLLPHIKRRLARTIECYANGVIRITSDSAYPFVPTCGFESLAQYGITRVQNWLKINFVIGFNMASLLLESASSTLKTFWQSHAWLHSSTPRVVAYAMFLALLVTAISVYGDVIPPRFFQRSQLSEVEQLMSGPPRPANAQGLLANGAGEALLTQEEFLSAKAKIWKNFREQVRQCGRLAAQVPGENRNTETGKLENRKQDACVEEARRDRRATQALAKAKIAPTPHSAEDRKVALY